MSDSKRCVKNSLFSPSVTGNTFEDFSQNAVLLPAMEKPPPPVLNITPEQILQSTITPQQQPSLAVLPPVDYFSSPHQPTPGTCSNQEPQEFAVNSPQESEADQSNFTSVLSSFTSYLRIGAGDCQQREVQTFEEAPVPAPAQLDTFKCQDISSAPTVPLFNATASITQCSGALAVPTGPVNTFRRSALKRPVYAPVPGLASNTIPPPVPTQPTYQTYFTPPQPSAPATIFQPSISPASSTSSVQDNTFALHNQFKPINPQPASFPVVKPNIPHPQHHPLQLGPVMDAIPASELLFSQPDVFPEGSNVPKPIPTNKTYRPVYHHWFHRKDNKSSWSPLSMVDSLSLEHAFTSNDLDPSKVLSTDGGRYDVNILRRQRTPVYWKGAISEVRRCSWFYKSNNDRSYMPYDENIATKLEEEFKTAFECNQWNRRVNLANGDIVEFHAPDVLVLYQPTQANDAWTNVPNQIKPRAVKRGMDEFDIDEGEPQHVDHLLFMVHGIGSVCDLKFRTVEEVVDEFRNIALQLTQSHYKSSCERGMIHRVEVLPISWHGKLHSEETGIDEQLKKISLESIPRLREFTNDTILDVLFYTSPLYSQTIISTVGDELNRVYNLFKQRNPSFNGGVSLGGHSLGSLILFDLLAHQHPEDVTEESKQDDLSDGNAPDEKKFSRRISHMMGSVGAGQPKISYPHLNFQPQAFFALGSPIGMFVTVRGLHKLGENFALPTCPAFFNVFHPYDPVAYRIEALINPESAKLKPVLIPHHKGRKRMHLELKETMARVGADLKQKVFDSMKSTWNSFYQLAMFHRSDQPSLEAEVNKNLQNQLETNQEDDVQLDTEPIEEQTDIPLGQLNKGRRIDYVLQEAPLEFFNEYIFALTSHVCYWESEDTILMILKEIYTSMNIQTDNKIPQQTMAIEIPLPSPKFEKQSPGTSDIRMDPTYPITADSNISPPPTAGFIRKT
ncbi:unnamed protein product [Ceutorhynchus assimilis]|uniref:Uncharacterized protein n=1 Tax=Ceutorhynchus assimilis TaxID=467358 RepID=A0A9P0GXU5_9CUCU|nr:unnamed protein product [Ceutorhynchus assimilis]